MSGQKVRAAVIGVGYLGRFHAQKYAALPGCTLAAVVDSNPAQAQKVARELGVAWFTDHRQVLDLVDAVSVVTPTETHHQVAGDFLRAGKDVLCEKPITTSLEEADDLLALAAEHQRILQVGHLERFNPAVEEMFSRANRPMFIECNRIAPFKARATDVDVALDLMIHDLDIILALMDDDPCRVSAVGVAVLGDKADVINARLEFATGAVANVTASRLAPRDERRMRIFQADNYMSLNFRQRTLRVVNQVEFRQGCRPKITSERPQFGKSDPLLSEIEAFVDSVTTRRAPRVGGLEGRRALACALSVRQEVQKSLGGFADVMDQPRRWIAATCPAEDE